MKKLFSAVCCTALLCTSLAASSAMTFASEEISEDSTESAAEESAISDEASDTAEIPAGEIGSVMEDFTVSSIDGEEFTLSALLETHDAVVLNFWFNGCGPCAQEFPFLNEAYEEYKDQVAVIALSPYDDADSIASYKEDLELTLPIGTDTAGLSDLFQISAFPTTIVIDRFGVVCFREEGSQPSTEAFTNLFSAFCGDDYTESILDYEAKGPKPDCTMPPAEEMAAALNTENGELTFFADDDEYSWPWMYESDEERSYAYPSNTGTNMTSALLCTDVTVDEDEVLAFDYKVSCEGGFDYFILYINEEPVKVFSGEHDWSSYAYRFEEAGDYSVMFAYEKDEMEAGGDDTALLDNVRLLSGEEADEAVSANPDYPQTLEASEVSVAPASDTLKEIKINGDEEAIRAYIGVDAAFYIASGETADFKVQIGKDCDPDAVTLASNFDGATISASFCEYDEEGYFYSTGIDSLSTTGYSCTVFYVYPIFRDYDNVILTVLFASEDDVNSFFKDELTDEDGNPLENVSWCYADGTLPSAVSSAEDKSSESALVTYTLTFVDQNGDPVPGVIANICDDSTCAPQTADDNGAIEFTAAPFAYAIHIIKLPDGYEFDMSQEFTASEKGGEMTFTINKAE